MHTPYEEFRKRRCDFIVSYRFLSAEEGGRKTGTPFQGYRCDFMYPEDEGKRAWQIHPEFLDENENVITDNTFGVDPVGKAKMWIIRDELIDYHKQRIKPGLQAFFVEGPHKVAECEVIELIRLAD